MRFVHLSREKSLRLIFKFLFLAYLFNYFHGRHGGRNGKNSKSSPTSKWKAKRQKKARCYNIILKSPVLFYKHPDCAPTSCCNLFLFLQSLLPTSSGWCSWVFADCSFTGAPPCGRGKICAKKSPFLKSIFEIIQAIIFIILYYRLLHLKSTNNSPPKSV